MRHAGWLHWILAFYIWSMACLPLGHWNLGRGSSLILVMVRGGSPNWTYIAFAGLATLTAAVFWLAYKRRNFSIALCASLLNVSYFLGPVCVQ